ncbi:TadE/TadG family type IV pilus assembly protein [Methylopila musalis]|uniref:TadE/TadG family type IV pilus assembly protein n=1 Tax=Methylopila musalis TaxID=1134781 RepID=A0ABW3Z9Z8_9HYPH
MRRLSWRRFYRDRTASAAVEFAIVAPVLVTMLAGLLTYGVYFGLAHSVQQLAADAVRASIGGLTDQEREQLARAHVTASAGQYVLIDPARVSVVARPAPSNASTFEVVVTYDARGLALWSLDGLAPTPTKTIARSAAIRRGGY